MAEIKGLDEVIKNLNIEIAKISDRSRKGMQEAGILIKGDAQERTPKDLGFLTNSAFYSTDDGGKGGGPRLRVGYTAEYAPWVHEMPMKLKGKPRADFGTTRDGVSFGGGSGNGVYWQGGENKFLEKAVKENHSNILTIIAKRASVE